MSVWLSVCNECVLQVYGKTVPIQRRPLVFPARTSHHTHRTHTHNPRQRNNNEASDTKSTLYHMHIKRGSLRARSCSAGGQAGRFLRPYKVHLAANEIGQRRHSGARNEERGQRRNIREHAVLVADGAAQIAIPTNKTNRQTNTQTKQMS